MTKGIDEPDRRGRTGLHLAVEEAGVELGVDEAVAGIGSTIVDAKTIVLLQWALLSGPFAR
jgi:hypothetical protein